MRDHFSFPGIHRIGYIKTDTLPQNLPLMAEASIVIELDDHFTYLEFTGEPTCEVETVNENKGRKQTVELTFETLQVIPEEYAIAFVVTDNHNQSFLVGHREEPYALITCRKTFGSPDGDKNTLSVEVVFTSSYAFIPITIRS